MIEREEFDALLADVSKCKEGVHAKIAHIEKGQKELTEGHKKLEAAIQGQSVERKAFNDEIKAIINEANKKFTAHTEDEMDTIRKIHVTLEELVVQTKDNTTFISSAKYNEELEKRVAQKINDINKPREELWHKVKMTAITVITGTIVTGVLGGIWVLVKLYMMMTGDY